MQIRPKGKGNHKYTIHQYDDMTIYYRFGNIHRDEGPAYYDHIVKQKIWYQYGKIHRVDGPALIQGDDEIFYWHDTPMEFDTWIKWTTAPEEKKAELIIKYG